MGFFSQSHPTSPRPSERRAGDEIASTLSADTYLFTDAILLAYRLGHMRYDEQKRAMLTAAREATDPLTFMAALERYGIGSRSKAHAFVGKFLSAPAYYRAQHSLMLGIREEGQEPDPFLANQRVLFLVEGVLTAKQQDTFFKAYWWFVHNHKDQFFDPKKGQCIGMYATEPHDNPSTLARFADYLTRLADHRTQRIRTLFQDFPTDIVIAILRRAFL